MMKSRVLVLCALASLLVGAATKDPASPKCSFQHFEMSQKFYERTGGFVDEHNHRAKSLALICTSPKIHENWLKEMSVSITSGLEFPVVIARARTADTGIAIEIKDSDFPSSFLVAPESGFAIVNVSYIAQDNPAADTLKARITKEVWRALMYALGSGNDSQPICFMKTIVSLDELDSMQSTCPCPMTFRTVQESAARFGVIPKRRVTYKQACQEGWAPAPTNDVQKAIWDKVHAMPKNPMKIEFDPKKGR